MERPATTLMALNHSTILVEERNKERKSINPHSKKWSGLHLKQESLPTIPKSSLGKNCLLLSGHKGVHTRTKMEGKGKAVFVDRVCCIRVGDFWSLLCCSHVLTQCLWVSRTSVCVGGGPLLTQPPGCSALMWRYWNEPNLNGECLSWNTNRGKKKR